MRVRVTWPPQCRLLTETTLVVNKHARISNATNHNSENDVMFQRAITIVKHRLVYFTGKKCLL